MLRVTPSPLLSVCEHFCYILTYSQIFLSHTSTLFMPSCNFSPITCIPPFLYINFLPSDVQFPLLLCLLPSVYPRCPPPLVLASLPSGLAAFWSPGNLFLVGRQTCPASTPRPASKPAKNLRSIEEKMTPIQLTEAGNLGPRMNIWRISSPQVW